MELSLLIHNLSPAENFGMTLVACFHVRMYVDISSFEICIVKSVKPTFWL